ncbi:cytochrome P450 [Polymorphospora rubra]|uniref:cytochrome P450 n=1 Tax=Polymorphospora rubra TaxID=338584 RepID=UPI0033E37E06
MRVDDTLALAREGYAWLPNRRRRAGGGPVGTRLLGRRAVGLVGPAAARFFYDDNHVRRHGAIPGPVRSTLLGHGAVHTLDGAAHRVRKALFLALLTPEENATLADRVADAWDAAVPTWRGDRPVSLFDETSRVITRAVWGWAGVPLADADVAPVAADLVLMVDGFGTVAPRHWRARRARTRQENRLARLVEEFRADSGGASGAAASGPVRLSGVAGSALDVVAHHRDANNRPLDPCTAAVELLNLLRPTVAVTWFLTFAAHALHRWPEHRGPVRDDPGYATAFVHEVRRFYPFAPFVGGRAVRDLTFAGRRIPAGTLVLLDLYGQNHDPELWPDPYRFDPGRFVNRRIGAFELVPQGGGDPRTGHRCPGEDLTVTLLRRLVPRLAGLDYEVPDQDLRIPLGRVPTRPRSGFVIRNVRPPEKSSNRSVGDVENPPAAST